MFAAVILAGGRSRRMEGTDKQLARINGVPVFVMSALKFQSSPLVDEIIIAAPSGQEQLYNDIAERYGISKLKAVVTGGDTRFLSTKNALSYVSDNIGYIAVHDGARPLISTENINRVLEDALKYDMAIAAVPASDTVKIVSGGFVKSTPDRKELYYAQTPQAFSKALFEQCIKKAESYFVNTELITDDSYIAEMQGFKVKITEIKGCNMKITGKYDLKAAKAIADGEETDFSSRVGHGYDVHRLVKDRRLVLCGAEIPYEEGLLGHSDADVAVHAVMDAILGALALGDIGKLFPDNDPQYKDADSMELLKKVINIMSENGYGLSNLDITIIAEKPKLSPFIQKMRENLSGIFGCNINKISVKATTEEGLGLAGQGISAHAVVVLLTKRG